jgi:hypothetical protein
MKSKLQIHNIKVALCTLLMTMFSFAVYAQPCTSNQSTADFYSKASGEFSNPTIWEYQDSCGNWIEATQPPSVGNSCRVRVATAVTKSSTFPNFEIKSLVLETGSTLLLEGDLTVSGGSSGGTDPDIEISGVLTVGPFSILHITKDEKDCIIQNSGSISSSGEVRLSGNMIVYGQYNGVNGKLTFDGGAAQVFDHSPNPASPPSNFGELVFSNTAGGITVVGNSIPVLAREGKTPAISEIVVTKSVDITGPVLINTGAKFTLTATGELSVGGNMTVHGQYNGVSGKLTFDGAAAQVLDYSPNPSSPPSNFGEVICNNALGVDFTGNHDITAYRLKGHLGTVSILRRTAVQNSVVIDPGAILHVPVSSELVVGGNMTVHGQFDGVDGKLTFDGAAAQVLDYSPDPSSPPSNFGEVICDNTVAVDITGNHDVTVYRLKGHLGTVSILRRTAVQNIVVIDPGAILHVPISSELVVGGNMTVHGQYNGVDGKLTFDGAAAQVLDYSPDPSSPPSNFGEVICDNTVAVDITGNHDITVYRITPKGHLGTVSILRRTTVQNSVVIDPGAILHVPVSSELVVGGNMTVHGQYNGVDGKLTFDGAAAQVLDYSPEPSSPPSNFGEVICDNTVAVDITGNHDVTVYRLKGHLGTVSILRRTAVQNIVVIDPGAILHVPISSELAVGGDMTVHGQYNGVDGKLTFDGTSPQVITYDPSVSSTLSNFGDVSFSNTSVAGIELTGSPIIAIFTRKAYATYEVKTSIPMVVQESFTIGSGASMEVTGATDITVGGNWINNGGTFIPGAGTVIFNGSGNSIIGGTSSTQYFNNLTVNKSGGTTNVRYECAICHARTITIQSGNFDAGTATELFVSGNWINNGGAFVPGTSTVIFDGTAVQKIEGLSSSFHKLTVNNATGLEIRESPTFPKLTSVSGDIQLANGKIYLFGGQDLKLTSDATITGASPSRYIVTNDKSTLTRPRMLVVLVGGSNSSQLVFPIGTDTGYSPVTLELFSVTGQPLVLSARVADGVSTDYDTNENPIGTAIVDRAVLKAYFVTGTIPPGDHITIHPQWNGADEGVGFNRSSCNLGHYTGGQWVHSAPTAAVSGNPTGTYAGSFDITVTSLSPFAVFSQSITNSFTGTTFCAGQTLPINYIASGGLWNTGNVFNAELSDVAGNFPGTIIGSFTSTALTGTINAIIPSGTVSGSNYRIRVNSTISNSRGVENDANLTISSAAGSAGSNGTLTLCAGTIPTPAQLFSALTGSPAPGGVWSGPVLDVYTYTQSVSSSCPSNSATVTVTYTPNTTLGSTTVTTNGSYTWPLPYGTGLTYTTSGVYTRIIGCNVATLNLIITVNTFTLGSSCGATTSGLNVTIITPFVSGITTYTFKLTNLITNAVQIINRPVNSFALSNYPGITLGTTYKVEVSINGGITYGPPCTINTPAPVANIGAQCGTTLTSMTQFVYCTYVASVIGYRFRVTKQSDNSVQVFDSGLNRFNFNQLPNRSFNTTYFVEVALKNTDGTYLPYNTGCSITTPAFPTSEVRLSQCDYTALSTTENFVVTLVSGATEYRFILYNTTLGYSYTIDRTLNTFNLNMFPGLLPATTYSVQVAVKIGGLFGPYGKVCNLTTPGGARVTGIKVSDDFKVIAFPNPFTEGFALDVNTTAENTVNIRVYDMLGKLIENKNVEVSEMENLVIGANYNSGVYNVIVSQGDNTKTLRVIKR